MIQTGLSRLVRMGRVVDVDVDVDVDVGDI